MSGIDEIIRHRLQKLKTNDNFEAGENSAGSSSSNVLPPDNKKTSAEKIEDLLNQLSEETVLENKFKKHGIDIDSQIRLRLNRLRERDYCPTNTASNREILISNKPPHEQSLPALGNSENISIVSSYEDMRHSSESEDSRDPYDTCALCDGKADIICRDCFNDAYCSKCFKEYHAEGENHKTVPYSRM